ncbi:MAG: sigma 54-interacting transcriptional regulator [Myxococcaceae bacterium]
MRIEGNVPSLLQAVFKELRISTGDSGPLVRCSGKSGGAEGSWLWVPPSTVSNEAKQAAIGAGAYDVIAVSDRDARRRLVARLKELLNPDPEPPQTERFVANSDAAKRVLRQLFLAAKTAQPVLLTGETGTGKEVSARLLHEWSPRRIGPFVPINCAAIPNELMEGELFGYAKGAFSGALKSFPGQIMAATGGTVFLDEIDDTPYPLQVKLLRVLEDHVVTRLGESDPQKVDFRILAATNRDLHALIEQGAFGADLYERLAIVSVHLPPLRERQEDLPFLVDHFIKRFYREEPAAKEKEPIEAVSDDAHWAMKNYEWPGNIRELRNVLFEALVYKRRGRELLLSDLPRRVLKKERVTASVTSAGSVRQAIEAGRFNLNDEVEALERAAITAALELSAGNAAKAASLLGEVGRGAANDPGSTLRAMMRRLGIRRGTAKRRAT